MSEALAKVERLSRHWGEPIGRTLQRERDRIVAAERDCTIGEKVCKPSSNPTVRKHILASIKKRRLRLGVARREFNQAVGDAQCLWPPVIGVRPFMSRARFEHGGFYRQRQEAERREDERRMAQIREKRADLRLRVALLTGKLHPLDHPRVIRISPAEIGGRRLGFV